MTADRWLSVGVIFLGLMQCLSVFYFFRRIEEPAFWFFAGGMLLIWTGALSLLRIRYEETAPGLRRVSVVANLSLALFWAALYFVLFDKFARNPSSFIGPLVIFASAAVSLARARTAWTKRI